MVLFQPQLCCRGLLSLEYLFVLQILFCFIFWQISIFPFRFHTKDSEAVFNFIRTVSQDLMQWWYLCLCTWSHSSNNLGSEFHFSVNSGVLLLSFQSNLCIYGPHLKSANVCFIPLYDKIRDSQIIFIWKEKQVLMNENNNIIRKLFH